ncbi:AMP-binding protein [Allohahella sp. A8]|uniref:AMP-binding protein n=1 Tax=Allohahella sp. A8 TaxID=3141461 RepID=UPI000C0A3C58|nr:long-chain fatty acid--CoA ligase [Hahellaceae bacterium]|tara:strand:+ start:19109 stop:20803 length:1695 start_codon:yes stop_codon:yes gene_type:complete
MNLADIARNKTPIEMFYHWEETAEDRVYLRQPIDGSWNEYTWGDVGNHARRLVTALFDMGFKRGDRIAILSKNCAEWIKTDIALQLGGFVSVPLYFDQTPETLRYVLEHSESKGIFVGKLDKPVWQRLKTGIPADLITIGFDFLGSDGDFPKEGEVQHHSKDLIAQNEPFGDSPVPADDDIWTIVYTSGTTGNPKGAVHVFGGTRLVGSRAMEIFDLGPDDKGFSFLPLAHVAERLLLATTSLYCGMRVSFTQSLDTFQRDLVSVQPTIFFSVPRLWKKFQGGILEKMPQKKLDFLMKIPVLKNIVAAKLRKALGLAEARYVISGAAPIAPSLLAWYRALGIEILEGYGMTENFAYGFIARRGKSKPGTVGQAMPDSGFKLSEQGEVLFKSPTLMTGYYREPEKTAEAIDAEGYYHSGDLGEIDQEGYLRITGRIKELFKTEKGEYVAPAPIEAKIASMKEFEQICLAGSGLNQPVAIVTLTEQARQIPKEELKTSIESHIDQVNRQLLNHEKLCGVIISKDDWLPESGMVTPTLKIKRNKVEDRYTKLMEQICNSGEKVIWER